ncbi:NS1 [CHeRI orbivirus 3-3]|nr:NS1 [CHeRI orbivirus 3-3]
MDHFIRYFNLSVEEAQLVRLCAIISSSWKCSHRSRDCLIGRTCVKENFSKVCHDTFQTQNYDNVKIILRISRQMMMVRGDLWCNALNHARNNAILNPEGEKEEALSVLQDAYSHSRFQEEVKTLKRINDKATPVYIDDSTSLVHAFYMPVSCEVETNVVNIKRLGRFLVVFYSVESNKMDVLWQGSDEARKYVTETLHWGVTNLPQCCYTGSKRTAQWIVWLPETMIEVFTNPEEIGKLLRILDMDLKTIQGFDTRDPSRICHQRFGIRGFSVEAISELLYMYVNGKPLIQYLLAKKPTTVMEMTIPMLVIRGYMYNYYTDYEASRWFEEKETCQCCYVEKFCANKKILVMDSKAQEILGRNAERAGRLIKHNDGSLKGISSFELGYGEMLSRQGEHWIAFTCLDSYDSLIVTGTLVHRYLRGEGITCEFDRQIAMNALARCYLYWGPTDNQIVNVIFRLMCYLLLKKKIEMLGMNLPWYDLGTFFNLITREERVSSVVTEKMHAAVARVSLLYLRLTVHGYDIRHGDEAEFDTQVKALTRNFSKLPLGKRPITPKGIIKRVRKENLN